LQRLSYLAVIFLFFPLIIITGFAMSPAITSVFSQFVTIFGGHQTARTLHFFLGVFHRRMDWRAASHALNLVGISPQAKFVVVFPYDDAWDSLDLPDAFHPQTFLTYGLNGSDLSTDHGAPLRLRVARQLGYKSVKYLSRITVTDSLKNVKNGLGSVQPDFGYSWYAGI